MRRPARLSGLKYASLRRGISLSRFGKIRPDCRGGEVWPRSHQPKICPHLLFYQEMGAVVLPCYAGRAMAPRLPLPRAVLTCPGTRRPAWR